MFEYLQKLQNRCNDNPRLKGLYLYNCSFKSHDQNSIWKPRLSTLLYLANYKCNSHSVKHYIELSWKWPNIAMVLEPTVLIFCLIWLVWPDYVYHQFTWHPYRTFPLSWYLAALDPLTCLGSSSYLGLHLHDRTTPLACLPLHQFWHAWVISTAITKISSVAYSIPYQASISPCLACWRIVSASCNSIFLWLGPSCINSVCTRPKLL